MATGCGCHVTNDRRPMGVSAPRALAAPPVFVPYDAPLRSGVLLGRRDRFIATVQLDGEDDAVDAHCVNPGRMEQFVAPGARVWLLPAPEKSAKTRKLQWSWEAIERPHALDAASRLMCGCNTQRPNRIVRSALESRTLPGLDTWSTLKAEPKIDVAAEDGTRHTGRADFLLTGENAGEASSHYVEVKNSHLVYPDGWSYFPDSVSERAARHVESLAALVRTGHRATVLVNAPTRLVHAAPDKPAFTHEARLLTKPAHLRARPSVCRPARRRRARSPPVRLARPDLCSVGAARGGGGRAVSRAKGERERGRHKRHARGVSLTL